MQHTVYLGFAEYTETLQAIAEWWTVCEDCDQGGNACECDNGEFEDPDLGDW